MADPIHTGRRTKSLRAEGDERADRLSVATSAGGWSLTEEHQGERHGVMGRSGRAGSWWSRWRLERDVGGEERARKEWPSSSDPSQRDGSLGRRTQEGKQTRGGED